MPFTPSAQLIADLKRWEGFSLKVYADSKGLPTQGYGRHHGVNFGDPDIDDATALRWLAGDMQDAYADALSLFPQLNIFDPIRRELLVGLVFNMGRDTLAEFAPFISWVNQQEWDEAAYHIETNMSHHLTPYLLQVGARGAEVAIRLTSGRVLQEFRI
jgi:GH24 family phage-related lysozyme (muramidase)